jgi:peptide/nickel transport system permease protein
MNESPFRHMSRPRRVKNCQAALGLVIVASILAIALLAPWLALHDPLEQQLAKRRQLPSVQHPFGLDELGRDNLSRVIYGARLSLLLGLAPTLLAVAAGGALGGAAGYRGGWLDSLITSGLDAMLAFPTLLLALALVVAVGRGPAGVVYALAFAAAPTYARLVRVRVLAVKQQEYVLAARAIGASPLYVLWRHVLPGCRAPLQAQAALGIGAAILEAAGLGFLGVGAQPPAPEWGAMLGQGRGAILGAPHVVLFPGLALILTVLGFNLVSDVWQE